MASSLSAGADLRPAGGRGRRSRWRGRRGAEERQILKDEADAAFSGGTKRPGASTIAPSTATLPASGARCRRRCERRRFAEPSRREADHLARRNVERDASTTVRPAKDLTTPQRQDRGAHGGGPICRRFAILEVRTVVGGGASSSAMSASSSGSPSAVRRRRLGMTKPVGTEESSRPAAFSSSMPGRSATGRGRNAEGKVHRWLQVTGGPACGGRAVSPSRSQADQSVPLETPTPRISLDLGAVTSW